MVKAEKKETLGASGNGLDPGQAAAKAAELGAARAEAEAQLAAARAALADLDAAPEPSPPVPAIVPDALRAAAREAREAAAEAADAEGFAAALPPGPDVEVLDAAEAALTDAKSASADLPPAWRRTAGSLISATGMVIVIAALSWDGWVYLVPAALVVVITADLRVAAAAHRAATARATEAIAATGLAGPEDLPGAQAKAKTAAAARARAEAAAGRRDETAAHWARLAPGTAPEDVEALIERLSSPVEPVVDPEAERARALATKLVEDAKRELDRIDEQSRQLGSFL
jgi:NADH-quinone oxidoreductase subunit C